MARKPTSKQAVSQQVTFVPSLSQAPKGAIIAWRPIWCAKHHFDERPCDGTRVTDCPPGPQVQALISPAGEIACGGGRGSTKSEATFQFIAKGNDPYVDFDGNVRTHFLKPVRLANAPKAQPGEILLVNAGEELLLPKAQGEMLSLRGYATLLQRELTPTDASYLNNPKYTFLVLRETSKYAEDWFRRALDFYAPYLDSKTENPYRLRFKSGALGVLAHMGDSDAYKNVQGHEYTRLVFEEATQVGDFDLVEKIMMSCRSTDPLMREQIMLTANPGGPGTRWWNKRYRHLHHADGRKVEPGQIFVPAKGKTRVFIHSTVYDNPYLLKKGYDKDLESITNPVQRAQWHKGDFDAIDGQYFGEFRANVLRDQDGKAIEDEEAYHVVKSGTVDLLPWWPRWIGMDWGFGHASAVCWCCQSPEGRVYVYRELVMGGVNSMALGAEIARRSRDDLQGLPDRHMPMYLSPDAWAKRDSINTIADQIRTGIEMELGVFRGEAVDEDMAEWGGLPTGEMGISVLKANNDRIIGWNYIRDLFSWRRVTGDVNECVPKLRFFDCCPKLIEAIPLAQQDPDRPEDVLKEDTDGDDVIDSLRHATNAHKDKKITPPRYAVMSEAARLAQQMYPDDVNVRIQMIQAKEAAYEREYAVPAGVNIPREGAMRWRQ
jgi:hypothetical protein